jgi:hypothetical protein
MTSKRTPAADWREDGEKDPHPWYAGKRREDLALGDLTDDQMANAVFLYADRQPDISAVIAGTAKMPIVYTTAAKDRIRWLSRQNEANAARVEALTLALNASTDRLTAIWQSTGTMEIKAQIDANLELLATMGAQHDPK